MISCALRRNIAPPSAKFFCIEDTIATFLLGPFVSHVVATCHDICQVVTYLVVPVPPSPLGFPRERNDDNNNIIRMFPQNENRNEGTFACSAGTQTGTRVTQRVHSPKPPFYKTALLSPREIEPFWGGRRFQGTVLKFLHFKEKTQPERKEFRGLKAPKKSGFGDWDSWWNLCVWVFFSTLINPTPATCHKRKEKLRCNFRIGVLERLHCNIHFSAVQMWFLPKLRCNKRKTALQHWKRCVARKWRFPAAFLRISGAHV